MRINHLQIISDFWNSEAERFKKLHPEHLDAQLHPSWGLWHISEKILNMFGHVSLNNKKILDLGCGRGHDSIAYAKLGAQVTAVDISKQQLENALPHKDVKYILASGENLPIENESINIAISDHGAFDHSPPSQLLKEINRVLMPGGQLIVCTYSPLAYVCYNEKTDKLSNILVNNYPTNKLKYDGKIINTEYSYSAWIKVFCENNFSVDRLEELVIPREAKDYFDELVDISWASRWPCDIIWSVTKRT